MPLRVCTGWEHGPVTPTAAAKGAAGFTLATAISATGTTVESGGDGPRTGTYFLRHVASATQQQWNYGTGILGTNQTRSHIAFAFRFPTSPGLPAGNMKIMRVDGSVNANPALFFRASDAKLVMANTLISQNPQVMSNAPIVAGQWYWIEMHSDISANPAVTDWWVDGVAQTPAAYSDVSAAGVINNINVGGDTTWTGTLDFDDLLIWTDTADIPAPRSDCHVHLSKADTAGTTTQIGTANATARMVTNSAIDATHNSANILAALSEVPPLLGASASGVGQRTSGTGNAVDIPMTDVGPVDPGQSIVGVSVKVCAWSATTTANTYGVRAFNAFNEAILFAAADMAADADTASPAWNSSIYTGIDGFTGASADFLLAAWSVRLGYSGDISPLPGAHAVYAEIALSTPAAAAWTPGQFTDQPVAWGATPLPVELDWTPGTLTLDPVAWGASPGEVEVAWTPGQLTLEPVEWGTTLLDLCNVRHFDGVDDEVVTAAGALGDFPEYTWATIVRLDHNEAGGLITGRNGVSDVWHVNPFTDDHFWWAAPGGFDHSQSVLLEYGEWLLLAVTKPLGTTNARFHMYRYTTTLWDRDDGTNSNFTTLGAGVDSVHHGSWDLDDEYSESDLLVTALWDRALSDGELDGLTADLEDWLASGPAVAWGFNQGATSTAVVDLTGGGANETSLVGTTVLDDAGPAAFSCDLGLVTIDWTPGELTLSPVAWGASPQPVSVAWTPGQLQLDPVAWAPVPQPVTVLWTPGELTLAPVAWAPSPGLVTVAWTPGTLTLGPVAWVPVPGPVSIAWTPAQFAVEPVAWGAAPQPVQVAWEPGELILGPVPWPLAPGLVSVLWTPGTYILEPGTIEALAVVIPPWTILRALDTELGLDGVPVAQAVPLWTTLRAVAWTVELEGTGPEPGLLAVGRGGLMEHTLKVGDVRTLPYDLRRDLTGVLTVTFRVVADVGLPLIISRAGTIVDAADGLVDLDILSGDYGAGLLEMSARYPDRRPFLLEALVEPGHVTHPNRGQERLWLEPTT